MSKRLVFLFCLLLAVVFVAPAFAEVQNVKVGGDIIARYIQRNNFDLTKDGADVSLFNTVTRVRVDADLTDKVSTVIRLINERNWDVDTDTSSDVDLDLAYVTMKEFLYSPLTLTIGRQELHFGNDMIIGDGVGPTNQLTNTSEAPAYAAANHIQDLAYRKSFDAVRATLNYDPLVIDIVFAKADEAATSNADTDLWGINAGYKFSDKWNTMAEGYFWHKNDSNGDKNDKINVIGARVSTNPTQKLNLQQEVAVQTGKARALGHKDRNAWASQTMAYLTPGWKHSPMFGLIYSYFSGDANTSNNDGNKTYHQWDPMYENQTAGHIINNYFSQANANNLDLMAKFSPFEDVTLRGDYVFVTMDKALASAAGGYQADKKMLGHEIDATLTYDYTEDVQFGLLAGWFKPGKAFIKSYRKSATELIASCKVSF